MYKVEVLAYVGAEDDTAFPMFSRGSLYYLRSTKKGNSKILTTNHGDLIIKVSKAKLGTLGTRLIDAFFSDFEHVDNMYFKSHKSYREALELVNFTEENHFTRNGEGVGINKEGLENEG